jgi:hypothetical protein
MTATSNPGKAGRKNPYVGPRAFRSGEDLPARDFEIRELTDLLIAERIALLHSPSGAGKTSLIQAGVVPRLERGHPSWGEVPFLASRPLRVKTPARTGLAVRNRYIHSVALDLLPLRDEAEVAEMRFPEIIAAAMPDFEKYTPVLIFDQFEEILFLDPTDWDSQGVFFAELGEALQDNDIWVLFAMREDYMGGLDRYLHHIPGYLHATFRLDFLDTAAAKKAIIEPADKMGVKVTEEAADELVQRLRTIRVQSPGNGVDLVKGPYVQPFQLQVVCRHLWRTLDKEKQGRFSTIDLDRVRRHADIAASLRRYYRDTVTEVAAVTGADELAMRDWFESNLVTAQGFRTQTLTGPASADAGAGAVLSALQDAYLLRSDTRSGSVWYELAHDQLITPVLEDNRNWRESRLESWQKRARDWRTTRHRELLLAGDELRQVQRHASVRELTPDEQQFLRESIVAERDRSVIARARSAVSRLTGLVALLTLTIVILAILLMLD